MTVVGRSKLDHPALGTTGGSSLHSTIEGLWESVSDDLGSRYSEHASVANSDTVTIDHNFGKAIDLLQVHILTGTHPNLTKVKDPAAAGWTIAATSGFEKEKIDVTAPATGGPHTFAVSIFESSKVVDNLSVTGTAGDGYIDLTAQSSDPSSPAAGDVRVFVGSDGKTYKLDESGNKSQLGGGSGSGINYAADFFESDVAPTTTSVAAIDTTNTDYTNFLLSSAGGALTQDTASAVRGANSYKFVPTASGEFFAYPAFQLSEVDLGKALSIKFDLKNDGAAADYDVVVCRYNSSGVHQETISVAGTASAGTPASAQLPTSLTSFRGFFITGSSSTDYYRLFVRHLTSATDAVYLDTLVIGPDAVMEGAIVTDWESYTPTYTGFGTVTSSEMEWRRNGDQLEVRGNFTTGTTTAVEARLSFPNGYIAKAFSSIRIAGNAIRVGSSATFFGDYVLSEPSVSYFTFGVQAASSNGLTKALGTSFSSSTKETIFASTTIAEWSANTVMASRAVEEYAYNFSTTTTGDTTAFGYGPEGTPILAYAPTGTNGAVFRVRFKTPILKTDSIIVETDSGSSGARWMDMSDRLAGYATNDANTAAYGYRIYPVNETDCGVIFYSKVDAGQSWSGITSWRWRVRKVSGGAAVGFPVSARNVIGDTSGTAVPAGYVGENITVQNSAGTGLAPGGSVLASITLSPGVWLMFGTVTITATSGDTVATYWNGFAGTYADISRTGVASNGFAAISVRPRTVTITGTATYQLIGQNSTATRGNGYCTVVAIRIA